MTSKSNITYDCSFCGRSYKRKIYYDRHIICCELLKSSQRERELEIEQCDDTPNIRELYLLVQEMGKKYVEMSKKIDMLSKYVESKKKRISIIDWLNQNYKLNTSYYDWIDSIQIERKHLNLIFEYDFLNGIMYIFEEILPLSDEEKHPIRAFDQKENTLFIYNEHNTWIGLSIQEWENLILHISKLLVYEFKKWQDEHDSEKYKEQFSDLYVLNVKKVTGGNFAQDRLHSQIKNKLYRYLKSNLKNIVQFEFS